MALHDGASSKEVARCQKVPLARTVYQRGVAVQQQVTTTPNTMVATEPGTLTEAATTPSMCHDMCAHFNTNVRWRRRLPAA